MKEQSQELLKSWSKFAKVYDPIKCGSIDGIDCEPHDRAVIRAINNDYRPNKFVKGNPERTIFISRLSHETSKDTIKEIFSKYGQLKRFRMVRDIVTGMSKGYAFVEYEEEQAAEEAYRLANKMVIDGSAIFVDFECERLLKGWKPRRLGGGFGGKKESGQLRFGGRDRPFKKPIALELKEQEERRQRERERRAKEDERRKREKSRDRRRKSPVRETRTNSPTRNKIDKKKEENKRNKSPLNAKSSDVKKTTSSKSSLKEDLPHINGKEQSTSKEQSATNKEKPKSESSKPATNQEKEKANSPVRDSQRSRRRSPERRHRSTKTTQSPVRRTSRERRENQKTVSPVSSRERSSPRNKPSRTARIPVAPLERNNRRSPPRSRSPTRSKHSHERDNSQRNREFTDRLGRETRHRSRSPLYVHENVPQDLHSQRPELDYFDQRIRPRLPLDVRQRYVSPDVNREFELEENSYRLGDMPNYREVSPIENHRARWSYNRTENETSYEYRRQTPVDYIDTSYENHTRGSYNDESHFNDYQSPIRERSIERAYSDNGRRPYSEQTYSEYDRYRNSYDDQRRDDYDTNRSYYPHRREEMERREMHWNNQVSRSSIGQVENNYPARSARLSSEDVRDRSNILHLKKVASSFRR